MIAEFYSVGNIIELKDIMGTMRYRICFGFVYVNKTHLDWKPVFKKYTSKQS